MFIEYEFHAFAVMLHSTPQAKAGCMETDLFCTSSCSMALCVRVPGGWSVLYMEMLIKRPGKTVTP